MDSYISAAVAAEIARGDPEAARARKRLIAGMPFLPVNREVGSLADLYAAALDLPEAAYADSVHLALAAYHAVDYLLTWNCRHIASGRVQRIVNEVNESNGVRTPTMCTPEQLMEL